MGFFLRERLAGKLTIDLAIKIGTICVCLLNMVVFQAGLRQHWGDFSHSEQRVAIMIFVMYPLPCLHYYKASKEPISNAVLVLMTYILLGAATGLIFR